MSARGRGYSKKGIVFRPGAMYADLESSGYVFMFEGYNLAGEGVFKLHRLTRTDVIDTGKLVTLSLYAMQNNMVTIN